MKKSILFLSMVAGISLCAADAAKQSAPAPAPAPAPAAQAKAAAPAPAAQTKAAAPAPAAQAKAAAPAPAAQTKAAAPAQPAPAVQAQPAAQTPAAAPQKEDPGIMFCIARGVCNITTGWLEIPRCMIYDNGFMPVFGLLVGIPEGAFLAVGRTLCGVYDIVSFGTSGSTCHGEVFPNTIFQSKWIYNKK